MISSRCTSLLSWLHVSPTLTDVFSLRETFALTLELRMFTQGGAGGLAPEPNCESSSPNVSVLPNWVIAGHFRGPGELERARRGVVALSAYAI